MPSAADRLDFGPPRDAGSVRAFGFALLVHALLIAALTWGVNWKRSDRAASFEAELWSSVPQEAAPKLVEAPPPPPPPTPQAPEVKATPPAPDVDIALEREKKRKLQQQKEAEAKKDKEKELKAKEDLAKRKAAEEAQKAEAKKQDAKDQAKQKLAEAAVEKQRQENIRRNAGLADAAGGASAAGSAQKSSGPSAGYKARLAALFKRNITFPPAVIQGNPKAVVQVQVSPSGLILSTRLTKSSGVSAWDEAVLRGIAQTERIPLDENGKVVPDFPVEFGPKD